MMKLKETLGSRKKELNSIIRGKVLEKEEVY